MHTDGDLPERAIENRTCLAKGCTNPIWQDVGIYCCIHYLACHEIYDLTRRRSIPDFPKDFVSKAPGFIGQMGTQVISWKGTKLEPIFQAMSDPLGGPNVYCIDTEFNKIAGRQNVSEVAIVDLKTNRIIVHAVMNEQRAIVASTKLARLLRLEHTKTDSIEAINHVRQVNTVKQMV